MMNHLGIARMLLMSLLCAGGALAASESAHAAAPLQSSCKLNSAGHKIQRVVHITFDNVHLTRDNPNVPSDLEQMPNLLNFLQNNGVVSGNHHTPLISHTANDILTALTGVYPDRHGVPVANSYGFFRQDGSVSIGNPSFLYWTAKSADGQPLMINENGKTHPAPWVPFTRAGCDVGAFSVANMEFESIPADVQTVFGPNSQQAQAVNNVLNSNPANPPTYDHLKARQSVNTDWLGIAIHCAQGSPPCSAPNGAPDLLPDEPGGYSGFSALYGNINVAPVICQNASSAACDSNHNVKDVNGSVIADAFGRPGFPNIFNPTAAQSLGYAAAMLERGIPVIYLYIADAHDRNPLSVDPVTGVSAPAHAFGPGEQEYVNQLKAYDDAFGKFFARLAANGITKDNTLFVVVPDENDHFVGSQPTPVGCDGINVPCNYTYAAEVNASLSRLLATQRSNTTPFLVHSDDAPTMYIVGNPAPTDAVTRTMEKDLDLLIANNPITGATNDKLSFRLADQAEMKLLHMVTASPARTPTLTMFGNEDYFFFTSGTANCSIAPACITVPMSPGATFAWNHGDVQEDITRTWMAMAGPGVTPLGRNDDVFSDHTDVRPTMLSLLGLKDSYVHDSRVLIEDLDEKAVPQALRGQGQFAKLATIYKQLNASVGSVGINSLTFANRSIVADDATYNAYLATIGNLTTQRDALASKIKTLLDGAAFNGNRIQGNEAEGLIKQAQQLIDQFANLAN
jgi:hypothetical protein